MLDLSNSIPKTISHKPVHQFHPAARIFGVFSSCELSMAMLRHPNRTTGKWRSGALLSAFVFIACFLCACSKTEGEQAATFIGNQLRLDIPAPIASLDPTKEERGSAFVFLFLYDSLFSTNEHGELVPELATSYEYDPLDFIWTIHLKKNARFHDGKIVKARDAIYSLHERLRNLRPEYYASVEEIIALSDESFRIKLIKDDPEFLEKIAGTGVVPEGASATGQYYDHPIGSGPFVFEYRDGEKEVGLVANQNYHGRRPALDRVTLYFDPDGERSWARLLRGDTDAAFGLHPVDCSMLLENKDKFYFNATPYPFHSILLYNTHNPLFQSVTVRKALSLAIDKEMIVKEVLMGYGQVAAGPVDPGSSYHDPDLMPTHYGPEEAIRLLMQEGWTYDGDGKYLLRHGKPFEFTILYSEKDRLMRQVAVRLQLNLSDIGVKARLLPLPPEEVLRRCDRNTDFEAVLTEILSCLENPEILRDLWTPIGSLKAHIGCFEHQGLTELLIEASKEPRPERAKELYRRAEALIVDLQPGAFLFQRTTLDIMSKRVDFPCPFSLWSWDIYRLRSASIRDLKLPTR